MRTTEKKNRPFFLKKTIAFALAAATVFALLLSPASAAAKLGDIDGDGVLTFKDSAILARHLARWNGYFLWNGDITYPGAGVPSPNNPTGFLTGYAQANITPPANDTIAMAGYSNTWSRLATGVADSLQVRTVAFRDEYGKAMLFITLDLIGLDTSRCDAAKKMIQAKTGISPDSVMITCSHTHTGPDTGITTVGYRNAMDRYLVTLYAQIASTCVSALADLDQTVVYTGAAQTANLTWVRRYYVQYAGNNKPGAYGWESANTTDTVGTYISHETAADEEAQYILLERANKKDILLFNWQTHPDQIGSANLAYTRQFSSDFVNTARSKLEEDLGNAVHAVFFQGAAGNLAHTDRRSPSQAFPTTGDSYNQSQQRGNELARVISTAVKGVGGKKPAATGPIQVKKIVAEATYSHNEADIQRVITWRTSKFGVTLSYEAARTLLVGIAENMVALFQEGGLSDTYLPYVNSRTSAYQETGITLNWRYSNSILNRDENVGVTGRDIELTVYSIGTSLAFVAAPYEMFDSSGLAIKKGMYLGTPVNNGSTPYSVTGDKSPFGMTFICEQANGRNSYIPTELAFSHGGYEAYTSVFASGTAEKFVKNYLVLLKALHAQASDPQYTGGSQTELIPLQ